MRIYLPRFVVNHSVFLKEHVGNSSHILPKKEKTYLNIFFEIGQPQPLCIKLTQNMIQATTHSDIQCKQVFKNLSHKFY
jgi:hypothetical protein